MNTNTKTTEIELEMLETEEQECVFTDWPGVKLRVQNLQRLHVPL